MTTLRQFFFFFALNIGHQNVTTQHSFQNQNHIYVNSKQLQNYMSIFGKHTRYKMINYSYFISKLR